ncbi:hypothetical protein IHE55_06525 [Streptomyces pactum]|uniref:Integral membrane protein n=1 Tax=Streptomyces pactum TaxID=68249 RepID=A0ABS0NH05_9ACTN|nr:hypothetical protein [Streptomyces pactum]MBH5334476.1 hypothetical protein [Streptomyces pactum]
MGHWWERNIAEPGKLPLFLALSSFILTFLITRTVTRMIKAGRGPFRNVTPGGLHIHHVVPGVVLSVIGGFGAVASGTHGGGAYASAVLFGVGAGLVLDEFALILHLQDVYWSEQGRQSVEAVVLTAALVLLLLSGFLPFGVNDLTDEEESDRLAVVANIVANFAVALLALVKGKPRMAVVGVLLPPVAIVGALRLARPGSWWARHAYHRRPRARHRSQVRARRHDLRWNAVRRRLQDWVGGFREPPSGPGPGPGTGADGAGDGGRGPDGGSGSGGSGPADG